MVQKVYYNENVSRDHREILQTGLECVGDLSSYEIAEVVLLAAKSLALLESPCVLDISHMGLIEAVLNSCGFDSGEKKQAMTFLRQKNSHQLKALCGGREAAWEKLNVLSSARGSGDTVVPEIAAVLTTEEEREALDELEGLWRILKQSGCDAVVRLDFSVANNMRYYSGVVFRGYLEGIPTSILSGGQYDRLPQKMGRKSKAIGFAIYIDLLQELQQGGNSFDVDTVILHDGTVETAVLTAAAEAAGEKGSVLVTRQLPQDRSWKTLVRFEKGKAVEV